MSRRINLSYSILQLSLNRIISEYFVSLSTTTRIKSYFSLVTRCANFSSLTIKSIVISSYSVSVTSINCIWLYFLCLNTLFYWYCTHFLMYSTTLSRSFSRAYDLSNISSVFVTPRCPCRGSLWCSLTTSFITP